MTAKVFSAQEEAEKNGRECSNVTIPNAAPIQQMPLQPAENESPTRPQRKSQYQPRTLSGAMAVHAASIVVVRMKDGVNPQPPFRCANANLRHGALRGILPA